MSDQESDQGIKRLNLKLPIPMYREVEGYADTDQTSITEQFKREHTLYTRIRQELADGTVVLFQRPEDKEPKEVIFADLPNPRRARRTRRPGSRRTHQKPS